MFLWTNETIFCGLEQLFSLERSLLHQMYLHNQNSEYFGIHMNIIHSPMYYTCTTFQHNCYHKVMHFGSFALLVSFRNPIELVCSVYASPKWILRVKLSFSHIHIFILSVLKRRVELKIPHRCRIYGLASRDMSTRRENKRDSNNVHEPRKLPARKKFSLVGRFVVHQTPHNFIK